MSPYLNFKNLVSLKHKNKILKWRNAAAYVSGLSGRAERWLVSRAVCLSAGSTLGDAFSMLTVPLWSLLGDVVAFYLQETDLCFLTPPRYVFLDVLHNKFTSILFSSFLRCFALQGSPSTQTHTQDHSCTCFDFRPLPLKDTCKTSTPQSQEKLWLA